MSASAAIAHSLLRQACQESKPTGGKVLIRCDLIERSGSSEAWYGGRARRPVGQRILHPLQGAEPRVPDTPPPPGGAPGTHARSLHWGQRDATEPLRGEPARMSRAK